MSLSPFNPAGDLLKALGINETNVLSYSLHFSDEEVPVCMVEVVVCQDQMRAFEEQIKRYKVTFEPLDDGEPTPKAVPELHLLEDGPNAAPPTPIDGSVFPTGYSWEQGV